MFRPRFLHSGKALEEGKLQQDPLNLDRLRDIVPPDPIHWWPPAPLWWLVIALVFTWGTYLIVTRFLKWRGNGYRREALRELDRMAQVGDSTQSVMKVVELSALLKRVALVTYPRQKVASLSGQDWLEFLSQTCDEVDFSHGPTVRLGSASSTCDGNEMEADQWRQLLEDCRRWIVGHCLENAT